ncbi:hypothetical protein LSH36_766g03107 [Paralvinella palmiformis]|uniref:RNA exonuclease 4 n=1 Tax=Paralvinella palmiformis TaxID=53620 RepID=A0AAD9J0D0_9ANNE|nr:hypothetical protein LSH36_766g03107 [Paralvinella palmiformis]
MSVPNKHIKMTGKRKLPTAASLIAGDAKRIKLDSEKEISKRNKKQNKHTFKFNNTVTGAYSKQNVHHNKPHFKQTIQSKKKNTPPVIPTNRRANIGQRLGLNSDGAIGKEIVKNVLKHENQNKLDGPERTIKLMKDPQSSHQTKTDNTGVREPQSKQEIDLNKNPSKRKVRSKKEMTLRVETSRSSTNVGQKRGLKSNGINSKESVNKILKRKKQSKLDNVEKINKSIKDDGKLDKVENKPSDTNEKKLTSMLIPGKPEEISSNWKQLRRSLHIKHKKRVKKEQGDKESPAVKERKKEASPEPDIWFDGVDEVLIEASKRKHTPLDTSTNEWNNITNPLVKSRSHTGLTKEVAMDCEMVGTGTDGKDSILARVSIVNMNGHCLYDKYVQPTDKVTDYRTQFSGIRPGDMEKGEAFKIVQKEVHDILKGRILIGHAIHNDLKVLFLDHPRKAIRDTSRYKSFRKLFQGRQPALKKLSDQVLGVRVQEGEHNSVQDAQAAMRLYAMYKKPWEKEIRLKIKLQNLKTKMASTKKKRSLQNIGTNKGILEKDAED